MIFAAWVAATPHGGAALAEPPTHARTGFIECGRAQIRARAECYDGSPHCATETLSFSRGAGRLIVPLHTHYVARDIGGGRTKTLDYRAASWACVPGQSGGHYLVVIMSRADGSECADCEYSRLYDLNGRLVATDLAFDARGHAKESRAGQDLMHEVIGRGRQRFFSVYR